MKSSIKPSISVIITDLDNTLFDWFEIWYRPFKAMLDKVIEISEIPHDILIKEIKKVHETHGTAEYAFLLQELPSLSNLHATNNIKVTYAEAINLYRRERNEVTKLYSDVEATLRILRNAGCLIAGYTESMAFYTNYRVRKLGLDNLLDYLYSPPDHDIPQNIPREEIRLYPKKHYELNHTKHRFLSKGEKKPNPQVLQEIISEINSNKIDCIYIGDSLYKDIKMAQEAEVIDVYAKYGKAHEKKEYDLLRAVTHWTEEEVEKEKNSTDLQITPTFTLINSFSELLSLFEFKNFGKRL